MTDSNHSCSTVFTFRPANSAFSVPGRRRIVPASTPSTATCAAKGPASPRPGPRGASAHAPPASPPPAACRHRGTAARRAPPRAHPCCAPAPAPKPKSSWRATFRSSGVDRGRASGCRRAVVHHHHLEKVPRIGLALQRRQRPRQLLRLRVVRHDHAHRQLRRERPQAPARRPAASRCTRPGSRLRRVRLCSDALRHAGGELPGRRVGRRASARHPRNCSPALGSRPRFRRANQPSMRQKPSTCRSLAPPPPPPAARRPDAVPEAGCSSMSAWREEARRRPSPMCARRPCRAIIRPYGSRPVDASAGTQNIVERDGRVFAEMLRRLPWRAPRLVQSPCDARSRHGSCRRSVARPTIVRLPS